MKHDWKNYLASTALVIAGVLLFSTSANAITRGHGGGPTGCLAGIGNPQTGQCGAADKGPSNTEERHHHHEHWHWHRHDFDHHEFHHGWHHHNHTVWHIHHHAGSHGHHHFGGHGHHH